MRYTLLKASLILALGTVLVACNSDDDDELPTPNRSPNAMSVDLITQADVALSDSASASDPDGDALTYSLSSEPTMGMVTFNSDGSFTYTPNPTVTGMDSFEFSVTDGITASDTATVNITIENQVVSFASYSRAAFAQDEQDTPLPTNGREFTQDVTDPDAYDDLIDNP